MSLFVGVSGRQFTLNNQPWRLHGASVYGQLGSPSTAVARAQAGNVNCLRIVNFLTEGNAVATEPTREGAWTPVDAMIAACDTAGLKVILDLSTYRNLLYGHSINPYTTDWTAFLTFVANRVNTVSGSTYKNDPTIAFISLAGEVEPINTVPPDPIGITTAQVNNFFSTAGAIWKGLDSNHLLSSGGLLQIDWNSGIDYQTIFALSVIDFGSIHNYGAGDTTTSTPNVSAYCAGLEKPWITEEYGWDQNVVNDATRANNFQAMFDLQHTYGSAGSAFWNLGGQVTGVGGVTSTFDVNASTPLAWAKVQSNVPSWSYVIDSLTDTFSDGSLSAQWTSVTANGGTVVESGERVTFSLPANPSGTATAAIRSATSYDLTGDTMLVELPTVAAANATVNTRTYVRLSTAGGDFIEMSVAGGKLEARKSVSGTVTVSRSIAYRTQGQMRWMRLRHASSTWWCEFSRNPGASGSGEWLLLHSETMPITITALTAEIGVTESAGTVAATSAQLDTVNVNLVRGSALATVGASAHYDWGLVDHAGTHTSDEYAKGVRTKTYEWGWDRVHTADGTFSGTAADTEKAVLDSIVAGGFKVILGFSLQYPAAWVKALSSLVDQYGNTNSDRADLIFSATVRTKAEAYISYLVTRWGASWFNANVYAIRIGSGPEIELLYRDIQDFGTPGATCSYGAYGTAGLAAQDAECPATKIGVNYLKPGDAAYTIQQVRTWYHWYLDRLADGFNWQVAYIRSLGVTTPYVFDMTPGNGFVPRGDWYESYIASRLTNESLGNRGAVWWQLLYRLKDPSNKIARYCSSFAETSPAGTDSSVNLENWSAGHLHAYLGDQVGLTEIHGENPNGDADTTNLTKAITQMVAYQYAGLQWVRESHVYDNAAGHATITNYQTQIDAREPKATLTTQNFKNGGIRHKLRSAATYRDAGARFKLAIGTTYRNVTTRLRLRAQAYDDTASRFRVAAGATYRNATSRLRIRAQGYRDAGARFVLQAAATVVRPSSDALNQGWTTHARSSTSLYQALDDVTASDRDFVRSPAGPTGQQYRVGLQSMADPLSSTGHVVTYRIGKDSAAQRIDLTVRLKQGSTVIAAWTETDISTTLTTVQRTLSGPQADSITNYGALALEFEAVAV